VAGCLNASHLSDAVCLYTADGFAGAAVWNKGRAGQQKGFVFMLGVFDIDV
jgi:hypothetical protein